MTHLFELGKILNEKPDSAAKKNFFFEVIRQRSSVAAALRRGGRPNICAADFLAGAAKVGARTKTLFISQTDHAIILVCACLGWPLHHLTRTGKVAQPKLSPHIHLDL